MSLLLDALKRAEEAKRAKLSIESAGNSPAPADARNSLPVAGKESTPSLANDTPADALTEAADFSLADYQEVVPAKTGMRGSGAAKPLTAGAQRGTELSLERIPDNSPVDRAEEARAPPAATRAAPALQSKLDATRIDAAQSRDTARNVFVAKHATGPEDGAGKKWLLPVIAAVVVIVGGGGWYVWNEVNRMSRPAPANLTTRPSPVTTVPPASNSQPGIRQPVEVAPKAVAPVEPPLPPLLPPPAELAPPVPSVRTPATSGTPLTDREALARSLKEAPASKDGPVELKLARSIDPPAVNTELIEAYAALRQADYPRARALYAKLVQADPLNPDAQLGLATVFARTGDTASAARHYRLVLAIDPRNGPALAGLLAVSGSSSTALESELRMLVERNPGTASLRFTLGNVYATERRWVEAQQAYFEAFRLESDNADYIYNLAVSLDQLRQPKLALDYYQKCLAARARSGGQFDPATVARRIRELAPDARND